MKKWNCEFFSKAPGMDKLTVGTPFQLICSGEYIPKLKNINLSVINSEGKEDNKYKLVVLKKDILDHQRVQLTVTSYKTGKHQNLSLKVKDNTLGFQSQPLTWEVKSVLDKKPQPYGPYGPLFLNFSLIYWLVLGFIALSFVTLIIRKIYLKTKISSHLTSISDKWGGEPYKNMEKYLNSVLRKNEYSNEEVQKELENFNLKLKVFLSLAFKIPYYDWPLKDSIKRTKKKYPHLSKELLNNITTHVYSLENLNELSKKDISKEQIHKLARIIFQILFSLSDELKEKK